MPKLYTVAEANALLPELTYVLQILQEQIGILAGIHGDVKAVRKQILGNGHGTHAEAVLGQAAGAERHVREQLGRLHELDIELKDVEQGLIDFYHERAGRTVFLCWKLGEPAVAYWHDLETGFSARQPL